MISYLSLASKYFSAHKKKARLTVISVAISVALITGIFSMMDAFLKFEKIQVIHDFGNYHLAVVEATDNEIAAIGSHTDVQNSGIWISFRNGSLYGRAVKLGALDKEFAANMNITVVEGKYPAAENEIMLEQWAMDNFQQHLKIGDTVKIYFAGSNEKEFIISGIYNDLGNTKALGTPGIFLSTAGAEKINVEKSRLYLIEFKRGVNIRNAEKEIKRELKISDDRIGHNDRLLAVMGQSNHEAALGFYRIGAVLFFMVLTAGVVMIYNTFNMSVMDRVRHFGLLRCIGASQEQIKKLVIQEGIYITLRAIPIGILAGILVTFLCSAILKFYNHSLFGEMQLFRVSIIGVGAGIVVGLLNVFIAAFLPAKKAANVSPVNAVSGGTEVKMSQKKKLGLLVKAFPVETAIGMNNAVMKKKMLLLMASSIAISVILFLSFQVFVDFLHTTMKTTKPYTPDITLTSEQGIKREVYQILSDLDGTKKVYGRMLGFIDAAFDAKRLTDLYVETVGGIAINKNGTFDPPEKSWLISYDNNQFNWAKADLIDGKLSEEKLNEQNGVIAVREQLRNNVSTETANLRLGDKVYFNTPNGEREMTVMGILRSIPFSSSELTMTSFITTEKLFTELIGESSYKAVDIQLDRDRQAQTMSRIKSILNSSILIRDARQKNAETNQAFFTMALFIYGFISIIALISVLNIINTMSTSVASKTRYLGVMRAIGMSDEQLDRMVLVEAATYSLLGGIAGSIIGVALQKLLVIKWLSHFHIVWRFPFAQIGLILMIILIVTVVSVIGPLKRIKSQSVSDVIRSL